MNHSWGLWLRWCFVGAVALCVTATVAAQPQRRRPFPEDNHAFRFILHAQGLQPLQRIEELQADPEHTLLIVLGDTKVFWQVTPPGLEGFIKNGGGLLLATDRATEPFVDGLFGARITGETLTLPGAWAHSQEAYRGIPECPLIRNGDKRFPPFRDLGPEPEKAIATNRPSWIAPLIDSRPPTGLLVRPAWPNRPPLALASTCPAWYEGGVPQGFRVFALAFMRDKTDLTDTQRILWLADHSIFINSMMLQNDNGNFAFAQNLVAWLTNNGERKKVLFLDEGQIQKKFEVSPAEIPDPTKLPPEHLPMPPVEVLNQVLASWQDDDIFNRLLLERFSLNQILSGLALWFSAALVAYGLFRIWRSRYLQDVHP